MNERGFIVPVIIAIIVVAVVGVGAAVYLSRENENAAEQAATETDLSNTTGAVEGEERQATETEASNSLTGTVADLLKKGQNMTCTFNHTDTAGKTNGTVYIAGTGQRMRGDFTVQQPEGVIVNAHVIRDGGFGYFWSDELAQGTKIALTEEAITPEQQSAQHDVLDESIQYNCQPWTVDATLFNVPADKEFIDISQQLQPGTGAANPVPQAQCSTCQQLQEPAKSQCLKALGC